MDHPCSGCKVTSSYTPQWRKANSRDTAGLPVAVGRALTPGHTHPLYIAPCSWRQCTAAIRCQVNRSDRGTTVVLAHRPSGDAVANTRCARVRRPGRPFTPYPAVQTGPASHGSVQSATPEIPRCQIGLCQNRGCDKIQDCECATNTLNEMLDLKDWRS